MSEIKWIKLSTDVFNNRKIKMIETMPEGDALVVIWMKILILAGIVNDNGVIYFTPDIPYTEQMLATEFNRPLNIIQLALTTFQRFGMIDIINNVIQVSNWEKYQSVDRMSEIREYNRIAQQKHRAKLKSAEDVNDKSMTSQHCQGTDIDIDIDKDIYISATHKPKSSKMKDWKASVRTWENSNKKASASTDYIQRDYSSSEYEDRQKKAVAGLEQALMDDFPNLD